MRLIKISMVASIALFFSLIGANNIIDFQTKSVGNGFACGNPSVIIDKKTGKILAEGLNATTVNPTYHGEMVAINNCIKKHPHIDWSNSTL